MHGFASVPESTGLDIELNGEALKQHLDPKDKTFFASTPEWSEKRSWDKVWS